MAVTATDARHPAKHRLADARVPAFVALLRGHAVAAIRCRRPRLVGLGLAMMLLATNASASAVLSESDAHKVDSLKPMFLGLMNDLAQTARRTDISSGDQQCIKTTVQELVQISQELASYEYLITIEKDLNDVGENSPMRDVVKFAIAKSTDILTGEHKRLTELSDQCARFPLASSKTAEALQFVDSTTELLKSIQLHP
jgi:hypothetical protein